MISVTETAAEKINQALVDQEMDGKSLRLGVFPGGCGVVQVEALVCGLPGFR